MEKRNSILKKVFFIIIGAIIGSLATSTMFFLVNSISSGMKQGEELKDTLVKSVSDKIDVEKKDVNLNVIYQGKPNALYDDELIICWGQYNKGEKEYLKEKLQYNGRFIVIFEKEKLDYFDYIFMTKPSYAINYIATLNGEFYNDIFYLLDSDIQDINGDGQDDIELVFRSNFANRVSDSPIVLSRDNASWIMWNYNLDNAFEEIKKQKSNVAELLVDKFNFIENGNHVTIHSFPYGGYWVVGKRTIDGSAKCCFCLALMYENQCRLDKHDYAYLMFDFNENNSLSRDKTWNNGKPLISNKYIDNNIIFDEKKWSQIIDNIYFYNTDIK